MRAVVTYDVADDNRRAKLAARLSRMGVRLQESVFDCELDPASLEDTVDAIAPYVNERTDVLHVFVQCEECVGKRHSFGSAPSHMGEQYWIV